MGGDLMCILNRHKIILWGTILHSCRMLINALYYLINSFPPQTHLTNLQRTPNSFCFCKTKHQTILISFHFSTFTNPINQTPPLGQDMTQGQFLSGV